MKPFVKASLIVALMVVLAACSGGKGNDNDGSGVTDPGIAQPGESNGEEVPNEQGNDTNDGETETSDGDTDVDGGEESVAPAPTIQLDMEIEGFKETRTATLAESDNGYYMYTLPRFVFTPEEPGIDQVFLEAYGDYFMRITALNPDVNTEEMKAAAYEELEALVGADINELTGDNISNVFIREKALFYVHAVKGGDISKHIMLLDIDGSKFRITLHLPHGEALEGSSAGFNAMIPTIKPIT